MLYFCFSNSIILGIMVTKWRIFKTSIIAEPSNVEKITKATCVLHNYLRTSHIGEYTPPGYTDIVDPSGYINEGSWRQETTGHALQNLNHQRHRNYAAAASETRATFTNYFSSPAGQLAWQLDYVQRT